MTLQSNSHRRRLPRRDSGRSMLLAARPAWTTRALPHASLRSGWERSAQKTSMHKISTCAWNFRDTFENLRKARAAPLKSDWWWRVWFHAVNFAAWNLQQLVHRQHQQYQQHAHQLKHLQHPFNRPSLPTSRTLPTPPAPTTPPRPVSL